MTKEIEITEAMIDAGERELLESERIGCMIACFWDPRKLAVSVFRAMAAQRRPINLSLKSLVAGSDSEQGA